MNNKEKLKQSRMSPEKEPSSPSIPEASAQQPNNPNQPPAVTKKKNLPQPEPEQEEGAPAIPPVGPKTLPDRKLKTLIKENYLSGLSWGENAALMRRMGVVPKPGTEFDKLYRQLYDYDY